MPSFGQFFQYHFRMKKIAPKEIRVGDVIGHLGCEMKLKVKKIVRENGRTTFHGTDITDGVPSALSSDDRLAPRLSSLLLIQ